MSLEEAVRAIRSKRASERAATLEALASAASQQLEDGVSAAGFHLVDPMECTPAMAAHCNYRGGPGPGLICLVVVDEHATCPYAEYVP